MQQDGDIARYNAVKREAHAFSKVDGGKPPRWTEFWPGAGRIMKLRRRDIGVTRGILREQPFGRQPCRGIARTGGCELGLVGEGRDERQFFQMRHGIDFWPGGRNDPGLQALLGDIDIRQQNKGREEMRRTAEIQAIGRVCLDHAGFGGEAVETAIDAFHQCETVATQRAAHARQSPDRATNRQPGTVVPGMVRSKSGRKAILLAHRLVGAAHRCACC